MISLTILKQAARVTGTGQDTYLLELERMAVEYLERRTHRSFQGKAAVTEYLEGNGRREIYLPEPLYVGKEVSTAPTTIDERPYPGSTETTITDTDDDGFIFRDGQRVIRKGGGVWTNGYEYEVTYDRGYDAGDEPDLARQFVTMIVVHLYERRVPMPKVGETLATGSEVPHHLNAMMWSLKRLPV